MSLKLQDSVALVTGISSGIGSAIARHLAAAGATVVGTYLHNREKADGVVRDICAAGGQCPVRGRGREKFFCDGTAGSNQWWSSAAVLTSW